MENVIWLAIKNGMDGLFGNNQLMEDANLPLWLQGSTSSPWSGLGGGWEIDSSPRLGLETILGLLDYSLTYIGLHTRLWVQSLYTT